MMESNLTRRRVLAGAAGAATAAVAGCLGDDNDEDPGHDDPHAAVEAEVDAYVVAYHWGYAAFDEHGNELELIEVAPNTELTLHAVNDHAYDAFDELPDPVATQLEDLDGLARTREKIEQGIYDPPNQRSLEEVYEESHGGGHGHDDEDGHGHDDEDGHGHDDEDGHGHDDEDGHGHDDEDDHGHDDEDGHGHDDEDGHGHDDEDDHGHDDEDGHGHDDEDGHGHDHEDGKLDHGFRIRALNIDVDVRADATEPTIESAVVEEPGTYMAECTVPCGYYHGRQRHDLIRVTEDS